MKVLLDSCIWPGVKEELARAGHQAEWVGDWPSDPGDAEILAHAARHGHAIVTLDKDFGERGAQLAYSDPHVPAFPKMREHQFDLRSVPLDDKTLASQDCVVLVTDHDAFDYEAIAKHAKLLVDTRGRYPTPAAHIVKA